MPLDPTKFKSGDRVPGTKWVVHDRLGEGGMGVVFKVYKEPGIWGAMKVLRPVGAAAESVPRFFNEVRILAAMDHPNIVRVMDFDQLDEQTPFVVMDLLSGGTVRDLMRCCGGTLPPLLAYQILCEACSALESAHARRPSIVHRDFKIDNIFVHCPKRGKSSIVVYDFGIAVLADGKREYGQFGTPLYMAPEQIRGEPSTPRTDIYAAALVLYETLTGRLPWDRLDDIGQIRDAHLYSRPAPPSTFAPWIPRSVDDVTLAALAKNPADRPGNCEELTSNLWELQSCRAASTSVHVRTTVPSLDTLATAMQRLAAHDEGAAGDRTNVDAPPPAVHENGTGSPRTGAREGARPLASTRAGAPSRPAPSADEAPLAALADAISRFPLATSGQPITINVAIGSAAKGGGARGRLLSIAAIACTGLVAAMLAGGRLLPPVAAVGAPSTGGALGGAASLSAIVPEAPGLVPRTVNTPSMAPLETQSAGVGSGIRALSTYPVAEPSPVGMDPSRPVGSALAKDARRAFSHSSAGTASLTGSASRSNEGIGEFKTTF